MTTPAPISRFPVPSLDALPADLRERILAVQAKAGFVPNVFLALAHRPDECRAFFDYHDALMLRPSGLSKGEKEMIVVATSGANRCLYCVVAHGAILRIYEKAPLLADAVVGEPDFATLRAHGFTDEDIWDIGAITAFFGLSNRMANLLALRPNAEFYQMGRVPRG
jgi:AhpD family alkylhydroperoxidase